MSTVDLSTMQLVHETTPSGLTYRQQVAAINVLSYSQQLQLHSCPRRLLLEKLMADSHSEITDNINFLYGHAVGAGIQNYLLTRSVEEAMWEAFLAWKGDLEIRGKEKQNKSFPWALVAIMRFAAACNDGLLDDFELAFLADGKPAIEVAFCLDVGNGYFYVGHIDVVLRHKETGALMVLELKTTSNHNLHEAQYKNSAQALGYSLVVGEIARASGIEIETYEVLYLINETYKQQIVQMPFFKTMQQRAEWLLQLKMDCKILDFYRSVNHFPTHGESCHNFNKPCEFFGTCEIASMLQGLASKERVHGAGEKIEGISFYFHVDELEKRVQ